MRKLLFRFLGVLVLGAAALYLASRLDRKPGERPATPRVAKGPLGDMGDQVAEGGGTVQINPIRDVVVTLLDRTVQPGQAFSVFQPIAEVRGSKAEFKTESLQIIYDAVAVYELRAQPGDARGRRQAFEAVSGYRPPPGPRSPDVRVPAEQPAPATISHVRIAASEAALENENDRYRVRFFGGPPDGVQITLFDNQARPVLDVRTDRLTCSYLVRNGVSRVMITSDQLVRFFTPDGLYSLQGQGLWSMIRSPREKNGPVEVSFRLLENVQFVSSRGLLSLSRRNGATDAGRKPDNRRDANQTPRDETDRILVSSRGAAVLAFHQDRAEGRRAVSVDMLEMRDAVHIEDHRVTEDHDAARQDRVDLDLYCDSLRVWIQDQKLEAAEALGAVHLRTIGLRKSTGPGRGDDRSRSQPPGAVDARNTSAENTDAENTVDLRGDRARLTFRHGAVHSARVLAWSVRTIPTGLTRFGPSFFVLPHHVSPTVHGSLRDADTENGRFQARSEGDMVLDRLGRERNQQRARLALHRNVVAELEGSRRRKTSDQEAPAWVPGSSRIEVRDQLVFDLRHESGRVAELRGTGHVRVETLIGCLEAAEITGTIMDRDHWRFEADGYPRLEYPLAARTAPALARTLQSFSLTPRVTAPAPEDSKGRVSIEAQRAVIEYQRSGNVDRGQARFTEGVKVSQVEELSAPVRLFCHDLVFAFQHDTGSAAAAAARAHDPTEVRAEGNVILLGGDKIQASGDRLRIRTEAPKTGVDARGDRRAWVEIEGLPARLVATLRDGNQGHLEGRRLVFDGKTRTARVHTGVRARFFPARRDFLLPGGPSPETVRVHAAEIESEEAEVRWNENNEIVWLCAEQAVRVRGYAPLGVVVGEAGTTIGSSDGILIQWAEADCLHYEWLTDSAGPVRRLSFFGEQDHPVRFGYHDPLHPDQGDFLVVVPVFTMEGPAEESMVNRASGFGPGTICFLSQDNHFSASSRSGPSREKTVRVSFPHGFDLRRLNDDDVRLIFPHGGEVTSRDHEGKLEGWVSADEELGLLLNITARKTDEDSRVVDRGYARGNVRFQYREDTQGGCDEAFWERGTNTLTILGSPAWGQKTGEPRQTFRKATYNRATRRFQLYHGAGSLRSRFEKKTPGEPESKSTRAPGARTRPAQ